MKIVAISDTHNKFDVTKIPIGDVLIHAGDATVNGTAEELSYFFSLFCSLPHKYKIFVPGNHDCLDKYTELLTKDGWKSYLDVKKEDEVLSLNKNGNSVWSKIDKIIVKKSQHIYKYEKRSMNFAVTENHRIAHYRYPRSEREHSELHYATIKELPCLVAIPSSAPNSNDEYEISDNMIKLLGWIFTDGSYSESHGLNIYQSKPEGIGKIIDLLDGLCLKYSHKIRTRNITHICGKKLKSIRPENHFYILSESRNFVKKYMDYGKTPKRDEFNKFSSRQLLVFLRSVMDGDGSWNKSRTAGALNGAKPFLDWIQTLAVQCGVRSSMVEYRPGVFRLNLAFKRSSICTYNLKSIASKEDYNDDVWCLSVPLTNFMVRRGGKAYFTGNCLIERDPENARDLFNMHRKDNDYTLINRSIDIEGKKIFGFPYIPYIGGMWAYERSAESLRYHTDNIPKDIDILVTHSPAYLRRDMFKPGINYGNRFMLEDFFKSRPSLKHVICGHIHEAYGHENELGVDFYNVAYLSGVSGQYNPVTTLNV